MGAFEHTNWVTTRKDEIQALKLNNTWSLVPVPLGRHNIGC